MMVKPCWNLICVWYVSYMISYDHHMRSVMIIIVGDFLRTSQWQSNSCQIEMGKWMNDTWMISFDFCDVLSQMYPRHDSITATRHWLHGSLIRSRQVKGSQLVHPEKKTDILQTQIRQQLIEYLYLFYTLE